MSETIFIANALQISSQDLEALAQGRMIVTIPESFLNVGQSFALFSSTEEVDEVESFFWATCELCKSIDTYENLKSLGSLTVWSQQYLEEKFNKNEFLFLGFLRVYKLPKSVTILVNRQIQFSPLKEPLIFEKNLALLSDRLFAQRKQQLENLTPTEHPELEELQSTIASYATDHPEAQSFSNELQQFLGWAEPKDTIESFPNWVEEITTSGNSSDGDLFEKRVRQGFVHLGFTNTLNNPKVSLDPDAAGGAGGIDFYCEFPYSIVGECKASKSLKVNDNKDGAPFQLIKLGQKYLNPSGFSHAIKIIMAPGELTKDANLTAIGNQMNIMRPETLQRLVELKIAHPGSIDLLELKPCLEAEPFGTGADKKLNEFIDEIQQKLKVRSHIVSTLKKFVHDRNLKEISFEKFCGVLYASHPPEDLKDRDIYNILIELSSPLAGYLGRTKCDNWKGDRFYFLRDLTV